MSHNHYNNMHAAIFVLCQQCSKGTVPGASCTCTTYHNCDLVIKPADMLHLHAVVLLHLQA